MLAPYPLRSFVRNPVWLPVAGVALVGLAAGVGVGALWARARRRGATAPPLPSVSGGGGRRPSPGAGQADMFDWTYPGPPDFPSLQGQILHSESELVGYEDRIWLFTAPFESPLCGDAPCQYVAQFRSTEGHGFSPTATQGEALEIVADWRAEYAPKA